MSSIKNTKNMSSEEEEFMGDESSEEEFQGDEESEEEEDFIVADEEVVEESDDDAPLASLKKKKAKIIVEDDESSSDEDDDIPLAALKSPDKKKKKKPAPKKKASKAKAAKPAKKKTTKKKKKDAAATSSNGAFRTASEALYGSECSKGQLIQRLLCRWWYAITWPDNLPDDPPKHYDSLDGMPGVYVCTSGGDVGRIKDIRDKSKCPNFQNFAQKSSTELRDLLIIALKAQKEALVAAEGSGTDTEKDINSILKWAEKLNPDKADKQAIKVLKGAKLSLL